MAFEIEPKTLGYLALALFDFLVHEFLNPTTSSADDVIVMFAVIHFVSGLIAGKMVTDKNPRLLELGKDAIHRRQPHIHVFTRKDPINVLGTEMPLS